MSKTFLKALGVFALYALGTGAAHAQSFGWFECIDPMNMTPRSPDFGINHVENILFGTTFGVSGTVTYFGTNGPCYTPAVTVHVAGRFGFQVGSEGSIQSSFDDNMMLTFGMPIDPGGSWT